MITCFRGRHFVLSQCITIVVYSSNVQTFSLVFTVVMQMPPYYPGICANLSVSFWYCDTNELPQWLIWLKCCDIKMMGWYVMVPLIQHPWVMARPQTCCFADDLDLSRPQTVEQREKVTVTKQDWFRQNILFKTRKKNKPSRCNQS